VGGPKSFGHFSPRHYYYYLGQQKKGLDHPHFLSLVMLLDGRILLREPIFFEGM
jgi:hypothetical protein